jgi:hypothetical protein
VPRATTSPSSRRIQLVVLTPAFKPSIDLVVVHDIARRDVVVTAGDLLTNLVVETENLAEPGIHIFREVLLSFLRPTLDLCSQVIGKYDGGARRRGHPFTVASCGTNFGCRISCDRTAHSASGLPMRVVILAAIVGLPATVGAEDRVDLHVLGDVVLLERALPLDRHAGEHHAVEGSVALGVGASGEAIGAATLGAGKSTRTTLLAMRSELDLVRGHHRGLAELRLSDRHHGIAGVASVEARLDHGEARALAPVRIGPGRHVDGQVATQAQFFIGPEKDFVWVATTTFDGGATRWRDSPILDRTDRRALGLAGGMAPADGELPRGRLDLLRWRIEDATVRRRLDPAAASPDNLSEIRTVEVGLGATDLTLHIDHEMIAVLHIELGWSWLTADTGTEELADTMFRMRIGSNLTMRDRRGVRYRIGGGFARDPGYTPDGKRLVSEWREEFAASRETSRYRVTLRGALGWVRAVANTSGTKRVIPYAHDLEAAFAISRHLELGAHLTIVSEPPVAGDPWAAEPRTRSEAGLVLRLRGQALKQ